MQRFDQLPYGELVRNSWGEVAKGDGGLSGIHSISRCSMMEANYPSQSALPTGSPFTRGLLYNPTAYKTRT